MSDAWDESEPYTLNVWVESTKSLEEFERSLSSIIAPLAIREHNFSLGEIDCVVQAISKEQPASFPDIPTVHYSFRIDVPTTPWNFWARFDRVLAFALANSIRTKFSCRYLITADLHFFALFSGTNLSVYFNECYSPLTSGEVGLPEKGQRVHIPRPNQTLQPTAGRRDAQT